MFLIKAIREVWMQQKSTSNLIESYYFRVFDENERMICVFTRNSYSEYGTLKFNLKYSYHCKVIEIIEVKKNKKLKILCYDENFKKNRFFSAQSY